MAEGYKKDFDQNKDSLTEKDLSKETNQSADQTRIRRGTKSELESLATENEIRSIIERYYQTLQNDDKKNEYTPEQLANQISNDLSLNEPESVSSSATAMSIVNDQQQMHNTTEPQQPEIDDMSPSSNPEDQESDQNAENSMKKVDASTEMTSATKMELKMVAIGEQNEQKYEIINGFLGQESISRPACIKEAILTTDVTINNIPINLLDLDESSNLTEHFTAKSRWEANITLYFLPKEDYKRNVADIASKCDPKFWKRCLLLVDCTDEPESSKERIFLIRQDIEEILLGVKTPEKIVNRIQILPIGETTSLHLPGFKHWFAIICWTVLGISSTFSQISIAAIFAARLNPKYKGQTDKLYLRSIDLPADILQLSKEAKIGLAAASGGAAFAAGSVGATIGALIGALAIGISSFGIAAGAGLVLGGVVGGGIGVGVGGAVAGGGAAAYKNRQRAKKALEDYINVARRMVGRKPKKVLDTTSL